MPDYRRPARSGHLLDPLLAPASVALIGASTVPDSFGHALLDMARSMGFDGRIYPVNPKYAGVEPGFYATLADLPESVDHVVLGVANERVEECLLQAVDHGTRAVTLFADGKPKELGDRLHQMAQEAGLLVCGPNSMGFHNLDRRLRISPFPAPKDLKPGGIAAILQSGSVMGALAHNDNRLRFNMLVSPGSEMATTAADYLDWALDQQSTTVVGLFLETVRDPDTFLAALDRADRQSTPVVILKVGRTDLSRKMAMSHTGALVGNHGVFEAAMKSRGVHLVDTIDELAATLHLFSTAKAPGPGGLASLHDSGGERELLVDTVEMLDLPLATFSAETVARMERHLEPGLHAENPLDAWATGKNTESTFYECAVAMLEDPDVGIGLYVLDWRQDYYLHEMHAKALMRAAYRSEKPLVAMTNYSLTVNQDLASRLADAGIALLEGTESSLKAVRHLLRHRDRTARAKATDTQTAPIIDIEHGEAAGYRLLAKYGFDVPQHSAAESEEGVLRAAHAIGYPIALKTANPDIAHKTEEGGVCLGIMDDGDLLTRYHEMTARLGPKVLLCEMVAMKSEWSLGVVNDPDFGPAVMIGPGGVMIELLPERAVLMAPFESQTAKTAILDLKASRLLTGFRGGPPLAVDALADAAAALSKLAHDHRGSIEELDVNPILVTETRAVAADVLIKPLKAKPAAGKAA